MHKLSNWLQTNPIIVLLMFIVSATSGIAGLVLGWEQLFTTYLSKNLSAPVWLVLLICILIPTATTLIKSVKKNANMGLSEVSGNDYGVQQVELDGHHFKKCEFNGTELIFNGRIGFSLTHCNLKHTRLTFGENASITVIMLSKLYSDPALRPRVEAILDDIKRGELPKSVPPRPRK